MQLPKPITLVHIASFKRRIHTKTANRTTYSLGVPSFVGRALYYIPCVATGMPFRSLTQDKNQRTNASLANRPNNKIQKILISELK